MNEASIIQYITDTFDDLDIFTSTGNTFFFYDPERKFPFVTLVTNDEYDSASNLNRPSVFRLNIGISKQTFRSLFGSQKSSANPGSDGDSSYDFTALDKIMPHPIYGMMYWVCGLS